MPDIQIGDIIRVKPKPEWKADFYAGVFLVLEKSLNVRTMFLCAQGSKKLWLHKQHMEKL